jgi:hypothetical protein
MKNLSKNTIVCELTGLPKVNKIEYFLGEKSLGIADLAEMSFKEVRIKEAKNIGIDYYDRFFITAKNGKIIDSNSVKMKYNGKLEFYNDFKAADEVPCQLTN